jgi:hypothetical protein
MATDPSAVQLTPEQQALVAQLADASGENWSATLDQALGNFAKQRHQEMPAATNESFIAAARRLGLVGCLKGGPPDLSTNPIYMEGFGECNSDASCID